MSSWHIQNTRGPIWSQDHKHGSTYASVNHVWIEIVLGSRLWNELVKDYPFLCEIDCIDLKEFIEQGGGPNLVDGFCYVWILHHVPLNNIQLFIIYEYFFCIINFTESLFYSMWLFCHIEIPGWLSYITSVWLFSICLFDCVYVSALNVKEKCPIVLSWFHMTSSVRINNKQIAGVFSQGYTKKAWAPFTNIE